jgi:glutaminyl-tRNA synthetase
MTRVCRRWPACAAGVPEALRDFVKRIGVAKANSIVDAGVLDFGARGVEQERPRRMAVLRH